MGYHSRIAADVRRGEERAVRLGRVGGLVADRAIADALDGWDQRGQVRLWAEVEVHLDRDRRCEGEWPRRTQLHDCLCRTLLDTGTRFTGVQALAGQPGD